MFNGQLEMTFGNGRGVRAINARQRRLSRAQWWFSRMRQVVDKAVDWQPAPPPRPEQIWFPAPAKPVKTEANDERQICE